MKKCEDDYYWPLYSEIYAKQTTEMMNNDKYDFIFKNSYVKDDKIIYTENLHENWKDIYNKVLETRVLSVMECGCGPGHHLYNIQHLFPTIKIYGIELLESQCYHGCNDLKIPASFYDNVTIGDFTIPDVYKTLAQQFEFVFTQTVIQHLNHSSAINFIRNMAGASSKYVMLKENPKNHDYESLIEESGILTEFDFDIIPGLLVTSMFFQRKSTKQ